MKQRRGPSGGSVVLDGSTKAAPEGVRLDTLNPNDVFDVTVRVRRGKSIESKLRTSSRVTREEYVKQFGSSRKDLQAVEEFAHENQLSVVSSDPARHSVVLKGRVRDFEGAFGVNLSHYRDANGVTFRGRSGEIHVPRHLQKIIEGVFGLDNRPAARPMFHVAKNGGRFVAHAASASFTPNTIATIYKFPKSATGKGQCIGIIELGGGYRTTDLKSYFKSLKIPLPSVKAISVDGALNSPSTADSADGEVMLDIEVAGAVAPGASIAVYFAPNTDQGFLDAITTAVHDTANKPSVISISWGSAESQWTDQSRASFNDAFKAASLLGVSICTAAGDSGSDDSVGDGQAHVDFPSSSPFVLACGGTRLSVKGTTITSEVVWHEAADSATGGGVSEFFDLPDYQQKADVPSSVNSGFAGRGVPDVAGDADPASGYKVRVDGQNLVIGGTSAVAPLVAALIARVNQTKAKPLGFINPSLYANPSQCRDITVGNNITTSTNKGYTASVGWDACTGWGVPSGF